MSQGIPKNKTLYYFNKSFIEKAVEIIKFVVKENKILGDFSINHIPGDINGNKSAVEIECKHESTENVIHKVIQAYPWRQIDGSGYYCVLGTAFDEDATDGFKAFLQNVVLPDLAEHLFGSKPSENLSDRKKNEGKEKDWLETFDEDTALEISRIESVVRLTHKPTGITHESPMSRGAMSYGEVAEIVGIASDRLKEKLKAHYLKESIKVRDKGFDKEFEKKEESKRFSKWMKDNLDSNGDIIKKKEPKKPLHPGKVAEGLLIEEEFGSYENPGELHIKNAASELRIDPVFLKRLVDGLEPIGYTMAYRLAKVIKGTDVRFWMDLQERYDSFNG